MRIDPWDIFKKRDANKKWDREIKVKFPLRWIINLLRKKE